ncbi:MAG: YdcF family protein, partial [Alphaproteobacteria bacterium]|nr:YdcF family protein [Alphaproteobacteria bacterium]
MIYSILSTYLPDPITWVFLLLTAALILHHHKLERAATTLIAATATFLLALMVMPLDEVVSQPLENRYPRPTLPAHVDGIVVLSGGLKPYIFERRNVPGPNATAVRFLAGVELARRFPNARLVFTGVTLGGKRQQAAEHAALWQLVDATGLPRSRIIFEDKSTTTAENIAFCQRLLHPKSGETWLLV